MRLVLFQKMSKGQAIFQVQIGRGGRLLEHGHLLKFLWYLKKYHLTFT